MGKKDNKRWSFVDHQVEGIRYRQDVEEWSLTEEISMGSHGIYTYH